MITMDITFDGRRPGMRLLRKRIEKLTKKQLPKFKRKVIQEAGKRTKKYIIQNIDLRIPKFRGTLRRSIHRRTMKDRTSITVAHGGAMALEYGYKPHFIHRSMLSGGGYKVGDWMDKNLVRGKTRNYVLVGYGETARGIYFVTDAYNRINTEFSSIVRKHLKELKR